MYSGLSSKKMSSCKWLIKVNWRIQLVWKSTPETSPKLLKIMILLLIMDIFFKNNVLLTLWKVAATKGQWKERGKTKGKWRGNSFLTIPNFFFSFLPQPFRLVPNLAGPGRSKLGWVWYPLGHLLFSKLHKPFQNVMLKLLMPHAHRLPWNLTCVSGAWWKRKDPGDKAAPVRHSIWSLHNVVFFIAFTLHLDEIFKSLEISAQQMFMKV